MKYILFVLLLSSAGGRSESGWLDFPNRAQCEIKRAWYLQRLELSDGSKARAWVAECIEVSRAAR